MHGPQAVALSSCPHDQYLEVTNDTGHPLRIVAIPDKKPGNAAYIRIGVAEGGVTKMSIPDNSQAGYRFAAVTAEGVPIGGTPAARVDLTVKCREP